MNRIHALDRIVVDQIAAGEVVERPSSVVKELVENALDAGATHIQLRMEDGGIRLLEVRDNGSGIEAEDLPLALTSHATSKLRDAADLDAIASLGFRGEALASIASVSRLSIMSRPHNAKHGASLECAFGRVGEVHDAAADYGTRIVVENLFAELPARRKFLKTAATEGAHCLAWLQRLALVHLGVGFEVSLDGRTTFQVHADDDLEARCAAVFGERIAADMIEVAREDPQLGVKARIGAPETARRDARRVHLFLNGRWIRDARLLRAVREGVKEFVPIGHYPTLFLHLQIPPERIDVNVHPQKTEVRFRDERAVFAVIVTTLRKGLASAPWATRAVGPVGGHVQEKTGFAPSWARPLQESSDASPAVGGGSFPTAAPSDQLPLTANEVTPEGEYLNFLSVANTFLFRPVAGGVEIIDQHALHERVNLEELRKEVREGAVMQQALLMPALVEVSTEELAELLEHRETFLTLGVDIEAFGDTTIAIRGVPARLTRLVPESLLRDLLEIARQNRAATPDQLQENMLFSMACRGAVMAGDRLDRPALEALLRRGADLPQDRTCAHGRPVRVFLSQEDLERAFYRR